MPITVMKAWERMYLLDKLGVADEHDGVPAEEDLADRPKLLCVLWQRHMHPRFHLFESKQQDNQLLSCADDRGIAH